MIEVRIATVDEVLNDPEFEALAAEYAGSAAEGMPTPALNVELYKTLEQHQLLIPLRVAKDGAMIGFASVVVNPSAHYSCKLAIIESLFITAAHRHGLTAGRVLSTVKRIAKERGAVMVVVNAPHGGDLDLALSARRKPTYSSYFMPLDD